jgi:hypothetical protein
MDKEEPDTIDKEEPDTELYRVISFYNTDENNGTLKMITTTDKYWAEVQYKNLIMEWFGELCSHIDYAKYISKIQYNILNKETKFTNRKNYEYCYFRHEMITNHLHDLNALDNGKRKFEIYIEHNNDVEFSKYINHKKIEKTYDESEINKDIEII